MKIFIGTKHIINCDPTQEDLEEKGINTVNRKLVIKGKNAFLIPIVMKNGGEFAESDKIKYIQINFVSLLRPIKLLKDINYNIQLLNYKINIINQKNNWKMPIEVIN